MSQPNYVIFKGITNYSDTQLMTEIENGLKYWLDWSFLCIGGWTDVYTSGYTGSVVGSPSKLNWVYDASYSNGQVWQGAHKDWVWESGINYTTNNLNPVNITGVVIDNTPQSTGYYINYPQGKVIFTNTIPTGSVVKIDHSYRNIQVYKADDAPWWKELQFETDTSNTQFTQDPRTGDWSIGSYHRIQLPAIIIEVVPRGISKPYEIGNGSLIVEQDVLFHILTSDRTTRNNITSILTLQNDKVIYLFNSNSIKQDQCFPINYRGEKINSINYPDLVSETGYQWKKCMFTKTVMSEVESFNPTLYEGIVRSTLEIVFGNI